MEPKIVRTKDELELCYMRLSERFMSIAEKYEETKATADALRKENAELRKAHAKLLKDYAELRVNSALLVACDDALESMDANESKESEASHDR